MSVAWIVYILVGYASGMAVDVIRVSGMVVTVLSVAFSMLSWFLFSWAFKNVSVQGMMLSIITGVSIMAPFRNDFGPMAAVLVGLASGYSSYALQRKIRDSRQ